MISHQRLQSIDMKRTYHVFLLSLGFIVACETSQVPVKQETSNELNGKVYLFGVQFNEDACQALVPCDCCAAHLSFLNNTEFISTSYCMGSESFRKGTYTLAGDNLFLRYQRGCVVKEYNWESEVDSTLSEKYFIKKEDLKALTKKLSGFRCGGTLCFKDSSSHQDYFGSLDELTLASMIISMKESEIWEKL